MNFRSSRAEGRLHRLGAPLVLMASLVGAVAMPVGCVGSIGDGGDGDHTKSSGTGPGPGEAAGPLETTRYPRLSHLQWENTVRDLLLLDDTPGLSASFTGDTLGGAFDNNESSLVVAPGLWADYQLAAEDLSESVTSDPERLARLVPADAPTEPAARARAFIETFGKRAFRRPLTPDEVGVYEALFARGPELVDGPDDFARGVRITLQAFLQSPHFVYRVEDSTTLDADGLVALGDYEIATKLSYMLWNTMPDPLLFDAADAGELRTQEGIAQHAARLLEDERARAMVGSFHRQLYQFGHYEDLNKDETLYPDFGPELGADMQREAELFIDDVFESGGGVTEILTEPFTYVNAALAPLYGLDPSAYGAELERVELDPSQRAGFLTRIGFLASNATKREQHSIHRGVFINLRVVCADLPPPPDNVAGLPPAGDFPTNRERVESHTGEGTCGASCHATLINPAGFAFEHYDAVGRYRTEENGNPVNSADSYPLADGPVSYADAIEFSAALAASDEVHRCYAKHWLEFGYGRSSQDADAEDIASLATASRDGARTLILALTQTKAFRTRPAGEVAP